MRFAWLFLIVLTQGHGQAPPPPPDPATVRIDLGHVLKGSINRRGDLVGLHHLPSAPPSMRHQRRDLEVWFVPTSPKDPKIVRTVRVELRDPKTGEVVLEKFSTLYPDAWDAKKIEAAIREAYRDARDRRQVDDRGGWQGRTRDGVRIDGYLSPDGRSIATAFPIYVRPRSDTPRQDTPRR